MKRNGGMKLLLENRFQSKLIKRIKKQFDGCTVLKNDPKYLQGFPDIIVLYKDKFAILEVKRKKDAIHQPNQDYYIDKYSPFIFASFVYPENVEEVLYEMERSFRS